MGDSVKELFGSCRYKHDVRHFWLNMQNIIHNKIDTQVCHYSNVAALLSILDEEKVYASNFLDMNDSLEFMYAKKFLFAAVSKIVHNELSLKLNLNKSIAEELGKITNEVTDDIFSAIQKMKFYLFCSSLFSNSDGLLSMWRAYGKKTGVGIVYDSCHVHHGAYNCKVIYTDELNERHSSFIENDCFQKYVVDALNKRLDFADSKIDTAVKFLLEIASSYKHPGFEEEKEHRAVWLGTDDKIDVRIKGEKFISYIKKDFPVKNIMRLIVGPAENQAKIIRNLQLHEKINEHGIQVVSSTIPFLWDA